VFLSTPARRALLEGLDVVSVPVLYEGPAQSEAHLLSLVRHALYKSPTWRQSLEAAVRRHGQHLDKVLAQTEDCDLSEGLYVKWEQEGVVAGRYKYVRPGFTQSLVEGDGHWQRRPILPNELAPGADLYGGGS
jgi:hypothetical protein